MSAEDRVQAIGQVIALVRARDTLEEQLDAAIDRALSVGVSHRNLARLTRMHHTTLTRRRTRHNHTHNQEATSCR